MDAQIFSTANNEYYFAIGQIWPVAKDISFFLANIATSIGILFVIYQLYNINRSGKIEAHLNLIKSEREIWIAALQIPEISKTILTDVWGTSERKSASKNLFVAIFMDNCEHIYLRYKSGLLTKSAWLSFEGYILRLSAVPSVRASWADISGDYAPDFVAYINNLMAHSGAELPAARRKRPVP